MQRVNSGALILGIVIIVIGLLLLIGSLFEIEIGRLCLPTLLIVIGIFLIVRPRMVSPDTSVRQKLLGDIRLEGVWDVQNEEIWVLVGDIDLDLSHAQVPAGETRLRLFGFVADTDIIIPQDVGVSVTLTAFFSDAKLWGQKRDAFLTPVHAESENYAGAERKVRIEATFFVADVSVNRV